MSISQSALSSINGLLSGMQSASGFNATLGGSDFMQLLITELKNQDPTQPMDPTQEASQLAQFSSLQATQNLDSSFNRFAQMSQLTQGAALIGKNVTVSDGNGGVVSGSVQSVMVQNGTVMVEVNNKLYPMTGISRLG